MRRLVRQSHSPEKPIVCCSALALRLNCWQIRSFQPISPLVRVKVIWRGRDEDSGGGLDGGEDKVFGGDDGFHLLWLWFSSPPRCSTGHGRPSSSPSSRPANPS